MIMYKYLSSCYDEFMQDVDYDAWAKKIAGYIGNRKKGVDCGCGSGLITMRLKKMGYDVIGTDLSTEMLERARENFRRENLNITLVCMDSENLVVGNKVDFITAVCDVVNYMKKPEKFFVRAYNVLADDGVLLFDISSKYKLTEIIGNNVFTDSTDNVTYIWSNSLSEKQNKVEMFLTFFVKNKDGSFDKEEENQIQYIYEVDDLVEKLRAAGFGKVEYFGFEGKNVAQEERICFAAYKGKGDGKTAT